MIRMREKERTGKQFAGCTYSVLFDRIPDVG